MTYLTGWFIRNPVAANLLMALILLGGLLTANSMRIEGFPKLPADTLMIETVFADAYTEQVDEHITQKIELALQGLPGVKTIRSESLAGLSMVQVVKNSGYPLQRLLDDTRVRIDGISRFPAGVESPTITRNDFDFPALYLQLYGDVDPDALQTLSRSLKESLLALPEVSRLNIWGLKVPEIRIEVRPEILQKYNLTINDLSLAIQQSSLSFKAGELKTQGGAISIRADSQAYYPQEFADTSVFETADGRRIRLADVATIIDGVAEDDVIVRFNGQPAVGMEVLIGRQENLLDIAGAVKNAVTDFNQQLPEGVQLSVWGDSSHYIAERLNLLQSNALQGLLLVVIILALFLNLKLAFWVAMGIPISIAGAIAVMGSSWLDYSLNDVTTFGLIIALGILVDDAVVVGESVFEQRKLHSDPLVGTEEGVKRVATATVFGVLTTIAAFFPMLLIDNALGKVLAGFSGVVILALLFSLLESKFILPAHLAYISLTSAAKKSSNNFLQRCWLRTQRGAQQALLAFRQGVYRPILVWSLKQRYAVLIVFISLAVLGAGLMASGKIKMLFFPNIPGQMITVNLEMDARAPFSLVSSHAETIASTIGLLNRQYQREYNILEKPVPHVLVVVNSAFSAQIYAELSPLSQRGQSSLGTMAILKQWQQRVGRLEGATKLTFSGTEDVAGGFKIKLLGEDEEILHRASQQLITALQQIDGVSNLRDSLKNANPEIQLQLKPEARHLGFTEEILASQIGQRYGGAQVQRIQRNGQEVQVIVENAAQARHSMEDLYNARLKSPAGHWVPLPAIAHFQSSYSTAYIARDNGKRVSTVQAFIDNKVVSPMEVVQRLEQTVFSTIKQRYPSVTIKLAGELEQEGEMTDGLLRALIFTCVLIYALLAVPLKSYWQPLVIMSVLPFGFIGAALGHWIMDLPFSLLSFFGMLALTGVVVNDSLMMMTCYNQARIAGLAVNEALMDAGVGRFQAIFLTTATTVAGLTPLMLETSEQAQYLIPAAVSLVYGELFATAITLILIPLVIAIGNDIRGLWQVNQNEAP